MGLLRWLAGFFWNDEEEPKPGDLIEFFRGLYQHWAVYVGRGYVIHLTEDTDFKIQGSSINALMSVPTKKAMVKREKLQDVAGNNKWTINNYLDKDHNPRSPDVIVREANALVDQEHPYHLLTQNCEHFATKLRNGIAESQQVKDAFPEPLRSAVGL